MNTTKKQGLISVLRGSCTDKNLSGFSCKLLPEREHNSQKASRYPSQCLHIVSSAHFWLMYGHAAKFGSSSNLWAQQDPRVNKNWRYDVCMYISHDCDSLVIRCDASEKKILLRTYVCHYPRILQGLAATALTSMSVKMIESALY